MSTFILKITKRYTQDKLRIYSSSVSFYIIVSSLPLAAILFYILSYMPSEVEIGFERLISSLIPKDIYLNLASVLTSLKERRTLSLVPFSILTAIWSSTKGIGGLCEGIEHIFKVHEKSTFIVSSIKRIWRTLLFYLMTLASLLVFALGKILYPYTQKYGILTPILKLRVVFFAIILTLFFALLYSRLSHCKLKKHLPGSVFASLGWIVCTYFYSIYVSYAIRTTSIYAELGTVIFFMLWVYFCVNIILIGGEINKIRR